MTKDKKTDKKKLVKPQLNKTPTGITGLDEITGGGIPTGRAANVN